MSTIAAAAPTVHAADRLAELEQVIQRGLATFVDVGHALAEIRDAKLFRATHASFQSYLRDRWALSSQSAYAHIYAAGVADAITSSGAELPAGTSQDSMRVLVPLLNRSGPEAVAGAWLVVQERGDARRPPTAGDVRAALKSAGLVAPAPPPPRPARFEGIGDRLRVAIKRVEAIGAQLNGRPLPPGTRKRVMELASLARELADLLDGLTDTSSATARLRALEPDPPSAPEPELQVGQRSLASQVTSDRSVSRPESEDEALADLCIGHGSRRDPSGHCALCGRPDLYKPGINGERKLAQAS